VASSKTVLLVCRGYRDITLLEGFRPQPESRYIVASDDVRVHMEMEKYPWATGVVYLEEMEAFHTVAPDVIKYLAIVNEWLRSLGDDPKGVPRELLFWICHCEGGMTTQRIQDALLLIRSYQNLLEAHDPSQIVIFSHPQWQWEDDVLVAVGQNKGIKIRVHGRWRPGVLKARARSFLKLIVRDPYCLVNLLRAKLPGRASDKPGISQKEIVLQLCSPDPKHVGNILPLIKALKERRYDPVALQWQAFQSQAEFQQAGLRAENLETYAPMSVLWEPTVRVWRTWRQARRRKSQFFAHPGLKYRDISLGPLLWPSVQSFVWEELAQRFRLQQAAKAYFTVHQPLALRVWGGGVLPEGAILLQSIDRCGDTRRPLIFFWIMNYYDNPYESNYACIDLFLAAGDSQRQYLERIGVPSGRIVPMGLSRYDHLTAFQQEFSPAQSRACLQIHGNFQYYFLFDANAALRGFITNREQSLVTRALLTFAGAHPSVALIIKPHPVHRTGWLEGLINNFSLSNVFLISKDMLPYHALNAADLLITKFSTIALDAMFFKVPVISILLDGGQRFRIYGDAVENVDSLEALDEVLAGLVNDPQRYNDWRENQNKKQASFIEHYFGNGIGDAARMGAEALDKVLSNNLLMPQYRFNRLEEGSR
jgi:hypothetical protein